MKWLIVISSLIFVFTSFQFLVADEHDHKHDHDHAEEEHTEESSNVGLGKGVIAKGENGIQLSPESVSTFDLKLIEYAPPLNIAKNVVVQIKSEKTVFRLRDGWYKRVPVESSSFRNGDKIVVNGIGFLRMAEVAVEGGASHGHSH